MPNEYNPPPPPPEYKPTTYTNAHLIPNISRPEYKPPPNISPPNIYNSPEYKPSSPLRYSTLTLSFNIAENDI